MNYSVIGLIVLFGLLLITTILCLFNRTYCFIFEHKDWNLWNRVCKELPSAKFAERFHTNGRFSYLNNYKFAIEDIGIGKPVRVFYWESDGHVSVHTDEGCLLSYFDKYHVKKAARIIIKSNLLEQAGNEANAEQTGTNENQ